MICAKLFVPQMTANTTLTQLQYNLQHHRKIHCNNPYRHTTHSSYPTTKATTQHSTTALLTSRQVIVIPL